MKITEEIKDELFIQFCDMEANGEMCLSKYAFKEAIKKALILCGVSKSFASGIKVQIVDCFKGHEFSIGEEVEIVAFFEDNLWLAKGLDGKKWYITEEEANVC